MFLAKGNEPTAAPRHPLIWSLLTLDASRDRKIGRPSFCDTRQGPTCRSRARGLLRQNLPNTAKDVRASKINFSTVKLDTHHHSNKRGRAQGSGAKGSTWKKQKRIIENRSYTLDSSIKNQCVHMDPLQREKKERRNNGCHVNKEHTK